jgi:hypothetical protein
VKRPRKAVRVGVPILVIGLLALAALWRIGAPTDVAGTGATARLDPLTRIGDIGAATSALRRASLEHVRIIGLPSERTAWIDSGSTPLATAASERVFAVLDPDVKRADGVEWAPGARVTLIGIVRPSPAAADAMRQWHIDEATAADLQQRGVYLHVTEIRN